VSRRARFRLLALDLDGTLLDSRREIPKENLEALASAVSAGVVIAIVTGRRFPALQRFVRPLGRDTYVVANSGALIRRGLEGPILLREMLPLEIAERVLEIAEERGVEPVVHDGPDAEGHLFLRESARRLPTMGRYLKQSAPEPRWVSTFQLKRAPVQIGFTGSVAEIRSLEAHLSSELALGEKRASFARTEYPEEGLALLDVLSAGATKSRALEFLVSLLGMEMRETMAVGDNWNDLDMLERAGLGVVMANAVPELRSRGLAETRSNDEAGVAFAVARYLLEEER
jgi:Cof subfamily protein (haloacid dehalogenase superfamily)